VEKTPRVSIVIVTWNALPLLQRCLPSVAATNYDNLEIVVADNASTDGSSGWISDTFPDIKVVQHPENWAFCKGNNVAYLHTTGDYVLFLNNDVEVPADWLLPLVARMESDDRIGAVQPKLLQYDHRHTFEYAGASGGFIDRWGYPFTRGRVFFTLEEDHGQYDESRPVFWATGAAILLRRTAIELVGLFDELFFMHMEEIDLCWRLQRHGYSIYVEPESTVYHIGGGSLPRNDMRKVYLNFRNNLLVLYKNLPPRLWRHVFLVRFLFDVLAILRAVVSGRFREGIAIVRAYFHALVMKNNYKDIRPAPDGTPVLPWYRNSIVIDYFVRKRRRYCDLPAEALRPSSNQGTD